MKYVGNGKYDRYYRHTNPINITGRIKKSHHFTVTHKATLAPYHYIEVNNLPDNACFFNMYREYDIYRMYWLAIDLLNS